VCIAIVPLGILPLALVVVAMTLFVVGVRLFLPRVPAQLLLSLAFVRAITFTNDCQQPTVR